MVRESEDRFDPALLRRCEDEPIHTPGAIQSHGALLIVDAQGRIEAASRNVDEHFGLQSEAILGAPADALDLAPDALTALIEAARRPSSTLAYRPQLARLNKGADYRLLSTRSEQARVIVEAERAIDDDRGPEHDAHAEMWRALGEMEEAEDEAALYAAIAEHVRALVGFARVMVYRFDRDYHGQVVAESCAPRTKPRFLELTFPAADIPAQARALYLANPIRLIADAEAPTSPIIAHNDLGPIDLSFAGLRAVSPVHLQYLANMGVRASMSISIVVGKKLWGLIACHHDEPRPLDWARRMGAVNLSRLFSSTIARDEERRAERARSSVRALESRVIDAMARSTDLRAPLIELAPAILERFGADGLAITEPRLTPATAGSCPSGEGLEMILAWLRRTTREQDTLIASSDELLAEIPEARGAVEGTRGVLGLALTPRRERWLVLTRLERARAVTWGGDVSQMSDEELAGQAARLTPRGSFDAWKQTMRDCAPSWSDHDLEAAGELRRVIGEQFARQIDELRQINRTLARSNHALDDFAHIVSHDLKEPLRGIANYALFLNEDHAASLNDDARARIDSIRSLSLRLDALLDALLSYSRVGRIELAVAPTDLGELVRDVTETTLAHLIEERGAQVRALKPLPRLRVDRLQIRELLQNLIQNAIKYNDAPTPLVEIGALEHIEQGPESLAELGAGPILFVRDNGIGIDPAMLPQAFRMFRRLHRPDKYGGGSGVGLAFVSKIIARHNGRLVVDTAPERGSTFYFTLPDPPSPLTDDDDRDP